VATEQTLPIAELARRCAEAMARYRRRQTHDPGPCYELFRRALEHRDERAWAALYDQYHRLVRRRVRNAPGEPDALVNRAFERFWRAIPPERFADFATLDKLLAYLKRCAQSVAIDARREQERRQVYEAALDTLSKTDPDPATSPMEHLLDEIMGEQIFEHVRQRLSGHRERTVFRASLEWGLKPAQIAARWPDLFADAQQVSRIKERIFRRLRRDGELRILLERGDAHGGKSRG